MQENGQCHLSDISCVKNTKTPTGNSRCQSKETTDSQAQTNKWSCSPRCRTLLGNEIATIVSLKNVTGSGKRAHLAQVINFQFIALSEKTHFVLSNAL